MTLQPPLVSVIMPVYNGEKYVRDSIQSILNQTFHDFEFIIINDGSTDGTHEIINSIVDNRIIYIINPENIGIVNTLNKALLLANGKYISRTDADDLASSDKLMKQVDYMESNPEVGVVGTFYQIIDRNGIKKEKITLPGSSNEIALCIKFMNPFCNSTTLTRASIMKKYGYTKDYEYCEDFWLWKQILDESKGVNLSIYSLQYRVHGNNVSFVHKDQMKAMIGSILKSGLESLNIEFLPGEFDIHLNLFTYNFKFFREKGKISELENWVAKLIRNIKSRSGPDQYKFLEKFIVNIWIPICFSSGNYQKLFFNKIASGNQKLYYKELAKKFWKK